VNGASVESANIEAVGRFFKAVNNGEDFSDLVTKDVTWISGSEHSPVSTETIPWAGHPIQGVAEVKDFFRRLDNESFEVLSREARDIVASGDTVVVFGHFESRARPTGKRVASDFACRLDLREGRIARGQFFEDSYAVAHGFAHQGRLDVENGGSRREIAWGPGDER